MDSDLNWTAYYLTANTPKTILLSLISTKCFKQRTTPMSNILCLEHIARSMSISPNDHYIYAPLKASTRCPWLHLGGMVISRQPLLPRAAKQLPKWWIKSFDFILLFISLSHFLFVLGKKSFYFVCISYFFAVWKRNAVMKKVWGVLIYALIIARKNKWKHTRAVIYFF